MPKDPTRNQPNYKINGDHLNEYEYQRSKGAMTENDKQFPKQEQRPDDAYPDEEKTPYPDETVKEGDNRAGSATGS